MQNQTCALIGHHPAQRPIGRSAQSRFCAAIKAALEAALREAIAEGFTFFCSGGNSDFDLWVTEAVTRLQGEYPHIQHHFIPPSAALANGTQLLIVCHDGGSAGATAAAMSAAIDKRIPVRNIYSAPIRAMIRQHAAGRLR